MNLNYPDYAQGMGGYGSYRPKPPPSSDFLSNLGKGALEGGASAAGLGPYAALTGALAGTALSAYGTYKQGEQSDRDYQQQIAAWEAEQERQRRLDADNRQQQARQNSLTAGQYAQNLEQDTYGTYSPWARRAGL
jgi:hypothetical protein